MFRALNVHPQEFVTVLLNYHDGCIVLGLLYFGARVQFGWGGILNAG